GNAITEKQTLDAIMRARDARGGPLFHGMTDCGAGGFSSAVGEMGRELGAEVHLDRAPLKYPGLSYTEIWISEAQERMVLAVPPANLPALREICREEGVELADLGHFGTPERDLVLLFHGREVGRLSMHLLHEGIPMPTRQAVWTPAPPPAPAIKPAPAFSGAVPIDLKSVLLDVLAHPTVASKHWIIRQYDHEVRGNTIVKPLAGVRGRGPSDASVLEPIAGSGRGIAIACGLQTGVGDPAAGGDPYLMALAAIDEAVRNLVCTGADPDRIAILDNFCWPSCAKPENMGSLVRAAEGCYDGAKAYRTPFVSGKDSLNNQLKYTDPQTGAERVIEIPPTLLITGLGIVPTLDRCTTTDAKAAGNVLLLVGAPTQAALGGSIAVEFAPAPDRAVPTTDLTVGPAAARCVAGLIQTGVVRSAHDVSDGGVLACIAEMLIGAMDGRASLGAEIDLSAVHGDVYAAAFGESPSRYVLEVPPTEVARVERAAHTSGCRADRIGMLNATGLLTVPAHRVSCTVGDLAGVWGRPLDW
ncbi:MAG: hypothetical protein KIT68_13740, partial [Phycisphaeraceae bacterium]|nr:hypothetical protein [Phycisphaeraceae bacterium]